MHTNFFLLSNLLNICASEGYLKLHQNLFISYVADIVIRMEHVMRQDKHKQPSKPVNLKFCKGVAHYTQTNA